MIPITNEFPSDQFGLYSEQLRVELKTSGIDHRADALTNRWTPLNPRVREIGVIEQAKLVQSPAISRMKMLRHLIGVWRRCQVVHVAVLSKPRIIAFLVERGKSPVVFARLRAHFQRRDRLRLVISYLRKYLESLVRQGGSGRGLFWGRGMQSREAAFRWVAAG